MLSRSLGVSISPTLNVPRIARTVLHGSPQTTATYKSLHQASLEVGWRSVTRATGPNT